MPLYEMMFIVQPVWEGEALEEAIQKVKDVIAKEKGTVVLLKKLGKRRLAYEINDFREGSYVLLHVQAGREVVPVLEHFFKVNEGYLRYILIRLEENKTDDKNAAEPVENKPAEDAMSGDQPLEDQTAENKILESEPLQETSADDSQNAPELHAARLPAENAEEK